MELPDTKGFWEDKVPGVSKEAIKADCARPETISYLKKHGIPRLKAAKKWKGSVEDGITHLRKFKKIVVHPRCKEFAKECRLYRYKIDPKTDEVTRKIIDANNHCIDACRYGLDKQITKKGSDYKKLNQW